jgi:hypothetical protein
MMSFLRRSLCNRLITAVLQDDRVLDNRDKPREKPVKVKPYKIRVLPLLNDKVLEKTFDKSSYITFTLVLLKLTNQG